MAIRKQIMVKEETWRRVRALGFVTGEPIDAVISSALDKALGADPALAARVAQAERVAA